LGLVRKAADGMTWSSQKSVAERAGPIVAGVLLSLDGSSGKRSAV
jgi:hypothetical protein